jgi:hypothetical protein
MTKKYKYTKSKNIFGKLKKNTLKQFGYSTNKTNLSRHRALNKAVKSLGYSKIIKKLTAVRILNKNTNPSKSKIFTNDTKYLQNKWN